MSKQKKQENICTFKKNTVPLHPQLNKTFTANIINTASVAQLVRAPDC